MVSLGQYLNSVPNLHDRPLVKEYIEILYVVCFYLFHVFVFHLSLIVKTWKSGNIIKDAKKQFDLIDTSNDTKDILQSTSPHDLSELAILDFDSILVATNSFSVTNKLGQGGFGSVYKVKLIHHDSLKIGNLNGFTKCWLFVGKTTWWEGSSNKKAL